MDKQNKFYNIELLRFLFSLIIVLGHMMLFYLIPIDKEAFTGYKVPWNATLTIVDAFFVISGFFLFNSVENKRNLSVFKFVRGKIARLWPVFAFSIFVFYILSIMKLVSFSISDSILNLCFLQCSGLTLKLSSSGYSWYISSLFWVSLFYFYILTFFQRKNSNLIVALCTYFSYVLVLHENKGNLGAHISPVMANFFIPGILRALGGMGIGYFVGVFYKKIENKGLLTKNTSFLVRIIFSTLEFVLFIFLMRCYLIKTVQGCSNSLFYVLIFVVLFFLFLIRKGAWSQILNWEGFAFFGKYAFSIYIMQQPVFIILKEYLWTKDFVSEHTFLSVLVGVICCIIAGIITHHIIEVPGKKIMLKILEKNESLGVCDEE